MLFMRVQFRGSGEGFERAVVDRLRLANGGIVETPIGEDYVCTVLIVEFPDAYWRDVAKGLLAAECPTLVAAIDIEAELLN